MKFTLNNTEFIIEKKVFYSIRTSIEDIEEKIVENSNLNKKEVLIINSFSKRVNTILIPQYFKKNKKLLTKNGLSLDFGVTNSKCLEILISREMHMYNTIFLNTIGFDDKNIREIELFLLGLTKSSKKTFFLVNYNEKYSPDFRMDKFNEVKG